MIIRERIEPFNEVTVCLGSNLVHSNGIDYTNNIRIRNRKHDEISETLKCMKLFIEYIIAKGIIDIRFVTLSLCIHFSRKFFSQTAILLDSLKSEIHKFSLVQPYLVKRFTCKKT